MSKELYNQYKVEKNKFAFLKNKTQEGLKGLAGYIFENSHSVRDERKTDMNLYGDVAKAMIYQGLNGLDKNSTEENIKNAIAKVGFLNEVAGMKGNHKDEHNAKYTESIERVAQSLATKIKARGGNPQEAFEAIALDNPGWFRQIIEFFARCLFISTEYNSMRSMKNEFQSMNEEVKMTELRRHLVKDREFEQVAAPEQIHGSTHEVARIKKAAKGGENSDDKHKQEWFKKKAGWGLADIIYWSGSTISDFNKAEVIGAEMLRFLMGNENVPKYRLTEDGSVISQKAGFDKQNKQYKNVSVLSEKVQDIHNSGNEEIKKFAKEFVKLHGYNLIIGNPDLHNNNILVTEGNKLIPIDFGYSSREIQEGNLVNYKVNINPTALEQNERNVLAMFGITELPQKIKRAINECRQEALQDVVKDVEAKKEELFYRIEDVCHGLGIGPNKTKLVLDAINKNIDLVKKEAGMKVDQRQI